MNLCTHDCIGTNAFTHVGSQNDVNLLIERKYGHAKCEQANLAEIRVSAIVYLTLFNLGLLTDRLKEDISEFFTCTAEKTLIDEIACADNFEDARFIAEFIKLHANRLK